MHAASVPRRHAPPPLTELPTERIASPRRRPDAVHVRVAAGWNPVQYFASQPPPHVVHVVACTAPRRAALCSWLVRSVASVPCLPAPTAVVGLAVAPDALAALQRFVMPMPGVSTAAQRLQRVAQLLQVHGARVRAQPPRARPRHIVVIVDDSPPLPGDLAAAVDAAALRCAVSRWLDTDWLGTVSFFITCGDGGCGVLGAVPLALHATLSISSRLSSSTATAPAVLHAALFAPLFPDVSVWRAVHRACTSQNDRLLVWPVHSWRRRQAAYATGGGGAPPGTPTGAVLAAADNSWLAALAPEWTPYVGDRALVQAVQNHM